MFRTVRTFVLLAIAFIVAGTTSIHAQDFVVNSTVDRGDSTPGDNRCDTGQMVEGRAECTLRAAVDEVNALSKLNPGTAYTVAVSSGTYLLTTVESCPYYDVGNPNLLSRNAITLCISGNLTITGADPATTIIDGGMIDRMFFVSAGVTASINNVTIQHGTMAVAGSFDGSGGGINNQGTLTVTNDIFTQNNANNPSGGGGAIYNGGTLFVLSCSFIDNANTAVTANYAKTSINLSYFKGNTANQGSAVETFVGTLEISNSTFTNNTVEQNGIIGAYNTVATITNSTISNNTVGNAGTIQSGGNGSSLTLNNDTIYGNTAGNRLAGIVADNASIANTILAGNNPSDCTVVSLVNYGHNIIQTADFASLCKGGQNATTLTGVDPKLGPLTFHGGIFPTQQPLPGSPALGAGSDATPGSNSVSACTAVDQRGFVRGAGGTCSIGAIEGSQGSQAPKILPNAHGASGTATAVIYGAGFDGTSTVEFKLSGKPTLMPVETAVSPSTNAITVTLNLNGVAVGKYDVVVSTSGGESITLPAAFTVEMPAAPDIYSYAVGPVAARAGRPAFYSVVYGNRGNVDAYLVPLTLSVPGGYAGLISSPILAPPAANGQVIHDFTYVPVEVTPYSTTAFTNVPLIVPAIPAGSQGVLMFSLTPPVGTHGGSTYTFGANLGAPYGEGSDGAASTSVIADLVSGAQTYAATSLGVTLSSQNLAQMTAYATTQLAQELNKGKEALLQSAQGEPVFFSTSQLSIDIAYYGASLVNTGTRSVVAHAQPSLLANLRPIPLVTPPGTGPAPCQKGQVMAAGTSCDPDATPVPTKDPPAPRDGTVSRNTCLAMPHHHLSQDGHSCVPDDRKGCGILQNPFYTDPFCGTFPIAEAIDPNEKNGPLGLGSDHFVRAGDAFGYQIEFENQPTANAAAQTVTVTDPLDTTKYDLSTFQLGPISFGKYLLTPSPGLKNYTAALDLRPDANVTVVVRAGMDSSTGVVTWSFASLDPATMKTVTDPFAGFLPPNTTSPAGIGHVLFSISPLASLGGDAKICNSASIVFDVNAAIQTDPFCNSKDTIAPATKVEALGSTQSTTTFHVAWAGTDAGVGIDTYTIYVSDNGGAFAPWETMTTSTGASYTGSVGHTYGFYSVASDKLGNVETKTVADTTTTIGTAPAPNAALNPSSVAFGGVTVGSTAAAKIVTLSNTGNAPLAISSISLGGPNASVFTIASNSCGASLAASGVCNISIAFTPTTTGDKTATLSVADTVGTQSVSLAGTGTTSPVAQAVVSPSSASFGSITVGTTAAAKVFTLANAGNAALTINSVALSGANASAFAITANACGSSLAAGGSCAITTTFAPVSVGDFTATLSIVDTVGTQSATLTGTATAVPTAADFTIATTPPSQTTTNGGTVTYTVTVAPTGGTPFPGAVTLSATGAPAGSRITFSPATLTPGSAVATSTLTIVVPQAVATSRFAARDEPAFPRMALTFPLSFLALYLGQRRKRTVRMIATISLMLCAGAWMTGCVPPAPTTTATTSTLTITGTSGSTNHSSTVSLVVR